MNQLVRQRTSRHPMPIPIDLAHVSYFLVVSGLALTFYLLAVRKSSNLSTPMVATAVLFGIIALLFAVCPFNALNGIGSGYSSSTGSLRIADVDEAGRRILFECYLPANRRRATGMVILTALMFIATPEIARRCDRASESRGDISSIACRRRHCSLWPSRR